MHIPPPIFRLYIDGYSNFWSARVTDEILNMAFPENLHYAISPEAERPKSPDLRCGLLDLESNRRLCHRSNGLRDIGS